ncbi:MAG: hypothetical protein AB1815_04580 [Bacillota bacterium]
MHKLMAAGPVIPCERCCGAPVTAPGAAELPPWQAESRKQCCFRKQMLAMADIRILVGNHIVRNMQDCPGRSRQAEAPSVRSTLSERGTPAPPGISILVGLFFMGRKNL